jgi:hypothetical protein
MYQGAAVSWIASAQVDHSIHLIKRLPFKLESAGQGARANITDL